MRRSRSARSRRRSAGASAPVREYARSFDSSISAKRYGTQVAADGERRRRHRATGLRPVAAAGVAAFARPVAMYRRYAERWAATLGRDVTPLTAALRVGRPRPRSARLGRRRSRTTCISARSTGCCRGDLNNGLAGLPGSIGDPHFVGLHRIEMGLWTHEPVAVAGAARRQAEPRPSTGCGRELPTLAVDPRRTRACGCDAGSSRSRSTRSTTCCARTRSSKTPSVT